MSHVLRAVGVFTSGCSIAGSTFMVVSYVCLKLLGVIPMRLSWFLAIADVCWSGTLFVLFLSGSTCNSVLTLVALYFQLASLLWSACVAHHIHTTITRSRSAAPKRFSVLAKEAMYHAISWLTPLPLILPAAIYTFGPKNNGNVICFVTHSISGDGGVSPTHILAVWAAPTAFRILVMLVLLSSYLHLLLRQCSFQPHVRLESDALTRSGASGGRHASLPVGLSNKVMVRVSLYCLVFVLCAGIDVAARIHGYIAAQSGINMNADDDDGGGNPNLALLSFVVIGPLQGFLDAAVYGINRPLLRKLHLIPHPVNLSHRHQLQQPVWLPASTPRKNYISQSPRKKGARPKGYAKEKVKARENSLPLVQRTPSSEAARATKAQDVSQKTERASLWTPQT